MLMCIRHGLPVFGRETQPVDWYAYIDGEDDQAEFERRAVRVAKGLDVPLDDSLSYVEVPFKLNTPGRRREIEAILAAWAQQGAGVVVYDSAQALFGGNQASGEVGDEVYSQIKTWAQRYNHTAIVIDHAPKGSESKGAAASEFGSIFKRARVGASLYLKQVEAVDAQTTVIDLFNPKSNTTVVDTRKGADPVVRFTIHFDDTPEGAIDFRTQVEGWGRLDALGDQAVTVNQGAELLNLSTSRTRQLFKSAVEAGEMVLPAPLPNGRGRPPQRYQRVCKAA
jgi:hypothetical protein